MKLYILRPVNKADKPWNPWYDKSFGFVVQAKSPKEAREIASLECGDEEPIAWKDAQCSTCTELKPKGKSPKVIMRDFHSAWGEERW